MRRRHLFVGGAALALAAGVAAIVHGGGGSTFATQAALAAPRPVTLAQALAVSRRLGAVPGGREVLLVGALRSPDGAALGVRGAGSGQAPSSAQVSVALAQLRAAGFRVSLRSGDNFATIAAPARLVESYFRVALGDYLSPSGRRFYAANRSPLLSGSLRQVFVAIGGFDNWARFRSAAIPNGGVAPSDVLSFYDVKALRDRSLDGSGETVVFPELNSSGDIPQLKKDLAAYAAKYSLPPFDLTIRNNPKANSGDLGEMALDLEVVHAIAPKAKLVVYLQPSNIAAAIPSNEAMVKEIPTSIISDSLGFCEGILTKTSEVQFVVAPWALQAKQDRTHYVASGDAGAYDCDRDHPAAVDFPSAVPVTTSVGGTSVFLGANGGYFRELAWGSPLGGAGGGGGVSRWFNKPSFQSGLSGSGRLVPDVAGLADINTGWHLIYSGRDHQVGGTSGAAPLWAGITALINQDLRAKNLPRVGSANAALYWIAQRNSTYHAFHDVTGGNNLLYPAKTGFDLATGWGTPDAVNLDRAWIDYKRSHH